MPTARFGSFSRMRVRRRLRLGSQSHNKVFGGVGAAVLPAVFDIRLNVNDITRISVGRCTALRDFESSGLDHNHFLIHVLVWRMGHLAGCEAGDMKLDWIVGVSQTVEHGAGLIGLTL